MPAGGLISCQFLCGLHYILFAADQFFRSSITTAILYILGNLISVCRRQRVYFSGKCRWSSSVPLPQARKHYCYSSLLSSLERTKSSNVGKFEKCWVAVWNYSFHFVNLGENLSDLWHPLKSCLFFSIVHICALVVDTFTPLIANEVMLKSSVTSRYFVLFWALIFQE